PQPRKKPGRTSERLRWPPHRLVQPVRLPFASFQQPFYLPADFFIVLRFPGNEGTPLQRRHLQCGLIDRPDALEAFWCHRHDGMMAAFGFPIFPGGPPYRLAQGGAETAHCAERRYVEGFSADYHTFAGVVRRKQESRQSDHGSRVSGTTSNGGARN